MLERLCFVRNKYLLFSYQYFNKIVLGQLSPDPAPNRENEMSQKQLDIFDTDYESANYTKTSQDALATIKPKIKTKREPVSYTHLTLPTKRIV